MRLATVIILTGLLMTILVSCNKETIETKCSLCEIASTEYYNSEIFTLDNIIIYGKWKLFDITGGIHGGGHELDFDYLIIKEYGIYGFMRNDSILEYGKIVPTTVNESGMSLKLDFEKDASSESYFLDTEKYVKYHGKDTLNLFAPCCDRYNYYFVRTE